MINGIKCESIVKIFENSVLRLHQNGLLDTSILHGDGSTTMAKKGGDKLGFSGHKHMQGEKVVALADRNCHVISPMTVAPGNRHEGPLFIKAFNALKNRFYEDLSGWCTLKTLDLRYLVSDEQHRDFRDGTRYWNTMAYHRC
jgi:hypothetical protein